MNAPWVKWVLLIVQSTESPIIFVFLSFVLVAVFFEMWQTSHKNTKHIKQRENPWSHHHYCRNGNFERMNISVMCAISACCFYMHYSHACSQQNTTQYNTRPRIHLFVGNFFSGVFFSLSFKQSNLCTHMINCLSHHKIVLRSKYRQLKTVTPIALTSTTR